MNFRPTAELRRDIDAYAERHEISRSQALRLLVELALGRAK